MSTTTATTTATTLLSSQESFAMPGIIYSTEIHCFNIIDLSQVLFNFPLCSFLGETSLAYSRRLKSFAETINPYLREIIWTYYHEPRSSFGYSLLNVRIPRKTNSLCFVNQATYGYDKSTTYIIQFFDFRGRHLEEKKVVVHHEKNIFLIIVPNEAIWFRYTIIDLDHGEDESYYNLHYFNGQRNCQTCAYFLSRSTSSIDSEEEEEELMSQSDLQNYFRVVATTDT
jgi:hypothetical protein